jgi:arylsulfatase A-like enzyme
MKTKNILLVMAFMAFVLASCQPDQQRPNVLFIVVDDLRPEQNCYGQSHIHSPNIDALAEEGLLFQNAYCNVPVCGASRASVMTGLRPTRYRFLTFQTWVDREAPDVVTLPRLFRDHGYHTVSNSKVFHHATDSRESWDEIWEPFRRHTWRDYMIGENIRKDTMKIRKQRGPAWESFEGPDSIYADGKTALKTIRDLRRLGTGDKPFFLAAGFLKPHLPFNAPQKYWDLYDPADIRLPANDTLPERLPDLITNWGELRQYDAIPLRGPVPDETARKLIHGYYACVSYTDAQIGMLLDELERLELAENTIVILWGDHGWNLAEHGLWCKHSNFDTSTRSALILKVPGKTKGARTEALAEYVDIYPTLAELCGLPLPDHLEGKSLNPLVEDPASSVNDFILTKWQSGLTIKTPGFAYTEWSTNKGIPIGSMLYDHRNDRQEIYNLAGNPAYEGITDSLRRTMNLNKGKDYDKPLSLAAE